MTPLGPYFYTQASGSALIVCAHRPLLWAAPIPFCPHPHCSRDSIPNPFPRQGPRDSALGFDLTLCEFWAFGLYDLQGEESGPEKGMPVEKAGNSHRLRDPPPGLLGRGKVPPSSRENSGSPVHLGPATPR